VLENIKLKRYSMSHRFIRFEMGDRVVCIKPLETLKPGRQIKGCGDLTMNFGTSKKGYGFMVEDEHYGESSGRKDWWNLPHNERVKWYYFTQEEMSEYFISEEEDYKAYLRDEKLKQVLS